MNIDFGISFTRDLRKDNVGFLAMLFALGLNSLDLNFFLESQDFILWKSRGKMNWFHWKHLLCQRQGFWNEKYIECPLSMLPSKCASITCTLRVSRSRCGNGERAGRSLEQQRQVRAQCFWTLQYAVGAESSLPVEIVKIPIFACLWKSNVLKCTTSLPQWSDCIWY